MEEYKTKRDHTPASGMIDPHKRNFWQRLKHSIIYGGEQTIFCLATDPLEPFINKWYQNKHGDQVHHVSTGQAVGGELAGDGAAFVAFVAIKTLFATPVNWAISGVRSAARPIVDWRAKRSVDSWAAERHVDEEDPRYKERFERYKTLTAENIVDSGIIAGSAAGMNLVSQRHIFKNKQSYATMLQGKVAGTAMTFAAMGLTGFFFPRMKHKMEKGIENKLIDPVMGFIKKSTGAEDEIFAATAQKAEQQAADITTALAPEKRAGLLKIMLEKAEKTNVFDDALAKKMLSESKEVFAAMKAALQENGYLANVMKREHYDKIEHAMRYDYDRGNPEHALLHKEASRATVQQSLAEKRHDLDLLMGLLDDAKFLADIRDAVKNHTKFDINPTEMTEANKNQLSEFLLTNRSNAKDPSYAVLDVAEKQATHHAALAHTLRPDGIVARIFTDEMLKHLPTWEAKEVRGIAEDYIKYYHHEAERMAEHFKADSPIVKNAAQRAGDLRSKYMPANGSHSALSA